MGFTKPANFNRASLGCALAACFLLGACASTGAPREKESVAPKAPSEPVYRLADILGAGPAAIDALFSHNFHVRHPAGYKAQKERLVLVKGGPNSRLLQKAVLISATGRDRRGAPLKVLSPQMQRVFGDFGGKISIQRSAPRWIEADYIERAAAFIRSLN